MSSYTFVKSILQTLEIKIESLRFDIENRRIALIINKSGQISNHFVSFAEIERLFTEDTIQPAGASPEQKVLPEGQHIPS